MMNDFFDTTCSICNESLDGSFKRTIYLRDKPYCSKCLKKAVDIYRRLEEIHATLEGKNE